MLQQPIDEKVLNCGMESFINDIITLTPSEWWASRDWVITSFLVVIGVFALLLISDYYEIKNMTPEDAKRIINEKEEKERKKRNKKPMNTIQKVCILLCIVFFFATAGFGRTPEIGAITTGLMVASFIGFFLFKDK